MGKNNKNHKKRKAQGTDWHARSSKPKLNEEGDAAPRVALDNNAPRDNTPKRKVALLIAYNGTGYSGLQINPDAITIESTLEAAVHRAGGIADENAGDFKKIGWARTARTDKGVHAAGNVVCFKMLMKENIIEKINEQLPPAIRVMKYLRVGKTFNAKSAASSRTYLYIIPSFAFTQLSFAHRTPQSDEAHTEESKAEYSTALAEEQTRLQSFRLDEVLKARVSALLGAYVGTKNYHNCTIKKEPKDRSNQRYIMSFGVDHVFEEQGMEFVRLKVHGQSFMLHQIRKMVGLVVAICQGLIPEAFLLGPKAEGAKAEAFSFNRYRVPTAPSLGLLLDRPHFAGYDKKVLGDKSVADKQTFDQAFSDVATELKEFKETNIMAEICKAEASTHACVDFLLMLNRPSQNWGLPPRDLKDIIDPAKLAMWKEKERLEAVAKAAANAPTVAASEAATEATAIAPTPASEATATAPSPASEATATAAPTPATTAVPHVDSAPVAATAATRATEAVTSAPTTALVDEATATSSKSS